MRCRSDVSRAFAYFHFLERPVTKIGGADDHCHPGAPSRMPSSRQYDKKARELKERQTEIALRVEQHQKGEGDFRTTLESLISLASRAAELFERSKPEQMRQLLAF